jgi:7-cyano-7-deazaguanine synthase
LGILKFSQEREYNNAMTDKELAVVLLSGGLDSCVAAGVASKKYTLALFHANYGQRTVHRELRAFRDLANFFQPRTTFEAELNFLGRIGGSSLTDTHLPVPEDESDSPGLPSTYVPFRNTVIIAAAVAWAEVIGACAIFIGANQIDSPGYPDCRPEYYQAYKRLIELGTGPNTHITLQTPLIDLDKAGIVRLGLKLQAPLELTWSCYQNEDLACGRCSSCRLRLKGFAEAGVKDPITYL